MKKKDPLTERIIARCYEVHNGLGPGFSEKVYQNSLKLAFRNSKLQYESEKEFKVHYLKEAVGRFRVDLIIKKKVILEIKAIAGNMPPIFESQLLSYLKASGINIGLLVNFGNKSCQIRRIMHESL
jgi:GxxExxY protein